MKALILALAVSSLAIGTLPTKPDAADRLATEFLTQADRVLQEDPVDGRFGLSRLPTFHGRQYFDDRKEKEVKTANAIQQLAQTHAVALMAFGLFKDGKPTRTSTMSGIWTLNHAGFMDPQDPYEENKKHFDAQTQFTDVVAPGEAEKLFANPRKGTGRTTFPYVGRLAVVASKLIRASQDSCLKCHVEVKKKGDPLGVVTLIYVPKKRDNP